MKNARIYPLFLIFGFLLCILLSTACTETPVEPYYGGYPISRYAEVLSDLTVKAEWNAPSGAVSTWATMSNKNKEDYDAYLFSSQRGENAVMHCAYFKPETIAQIDKIELRDIILSDLPLFWCGENQRMLRYVYAVQKGLITPSEHPILWLEIPISDTPPTEMDGLRLILVSEECTARLRNQHGETEITFPLFVENQEWFGWEVESGSQDAYQRSWETHEFLFFCPKSNSVSETKGWLFYHFWFTKHMANLSLHMIEGDSCILTLDPVLFSTDLSSLFAYHTAPHPEHTLYYFKVSDILAFVSNES